MVDMRTEDIDVSFDGATWFHLGGVICVRNLPMYKGQP
jgi:hypothetical protein